MASNEAYSVHRMLAANAEVAAGSHARPNAAEVELGPLAATLAAQPVVNRISPVVLGGLVRLADLAVIGATGLASFLAYVLPRLDLGVSPVYPVAMVAGALLAILAFQMAHLYDVAAFRNVVRAAARMIIAWTGAFAVMLAVVFFAKQGDAFSRVWFALWFTSGFGALLLGRVALAVMVRHWGRTGRLERRALLVGGGDTAEKLIRALEASDDGDIRICGIFDDRGADRSPPVVAGLPKLGTVDQLVAFARRTRVDLLIVTLPITAEERVLQMLRKLWVLPVDIRLSAHTNRLRFRPRAYSYVGDVPMLDVIDKPIADWDYLVKATFDRTVAALLVLLLAPVMLAVALAVRLESKGPALFRQKRYGFNNELIEVFKFRSMYVEQSDASADRLVTKGDPRVTRVGRIIRKTSLDELPQLFNVLRGELSLVGPRPHAVHAKAAERLYDEVVDGYFARHRVRPGITGWAQINGWRGETDTREKIERRVELDLYYIENWSVWFDLYILAMTPFALVDTRNAY